MPEYIVNSEEEPSLWYGDKYDELVRCKDCKYWDSHWASLNVTMCKAFNWRSKPEDFCSLGKRKEREEAQKNV